jgi:hypothetical protein
MAANAVKGAGGPAGGAPESDYVKDMRAQGKDPNDPDGTIRLGLKGNSGGDLGNYPDGTPKMASDDVATQAQHGDFSMVAKIPDGTDTVVGKFDSKAGPTDTVGSASYRAANSKSEVPAGATATDNAGSYVQNKTNPDGSSSQTVRQNADPADPRVMANIQAKQDYYKNDPQGQAEYKRIMAPSKFDSVIRTGKKLSEGQVYLVFNKIVTRNNYLLVEGRLAEGPMDWLKTKAKNLTTKVTADKLNSAWQKAGSPMDSEAVAKVLADAGVNPDVVKKVYTDLKIPAAGAAAPAAMSDAELDKLIDQLNTKQKKEILTYVQQQLRAA